VLRKGKFLLQTLLEYKGEEYVVLNCEKQHIIHPVVFGILPVWRDSSPFEYRMKLQLESYKLSLKDFWVYVDCALPVINGAAPRIGTCGETSGYEYQHMNVPILYSGAVLAARTLVNDYGIEREEGECAPCFCYKEVYELIFDHGILITTIDHSRDMKRVRKNIDLGYRDWNKKRDQRCIRHFIKNSMVGDYKITKSKKKEEKYLAQMRADYRVNDALQVEITVD